MAIYLPWITFFIGIFVGWLLTWLIMIGNKRDLDTQVAKLEADLHDRNANLADCREDSKIQAAEFKAQIKTLKDDLKTRSVELEDATAGLKACTAELEALRIQLEELQEQIKTQAAMASSGSRAETVDVTLKGPEVDDFTKIKGVGPALAARLAAAGIYRYGDLAEANPQELPNALGIKPWQKVEPEEWIAEAALLAEKPPQVQIGDDLTQLEGIGPTYATRLRASGITTFEQLANSDEEILAVIIGVPAWRRVNYGDWIAQSRLAAAGDNEGLQELQEELFSRQGDNLRLIAGVGEQSLNVLHDGGIDTYAALAAADPEALATLFKEADVRAGDFEAWIAEAKLRAVGKRIHRTRTREPELKIRETRTCPQDLELIDGIGTVYEQRLYEVGIGSFWEVGMLTEEMLGEILEVEDFQGVDLAAIKADALRLAAETDSMGHVWDGTEPDNFEALIGIGPVLERRLYAAGICTFEALAAASVEQLEKVCHAPAFQKIDYGQWIKQAKKAIS